MPTKPTPSEDPKNHPATLGTGKLRSPFIPLLWLLIPFLAVIAYGVATSPRFSH